jgi:membrane protein DedA with SNARE-associated domain
MHRPLRLILMLTLLAVAVPLVPFLAFGTRLDHAVAGWLDPPPAPQVLAAIEVGVLAADLLLPVPSSMVATLGGAHLGVVIGTGCAWLGMTAGAMLGWWLGHTAGAASLSSPTLAEQERLTRQQRRFGPLAVVLTRPLPLVAEAAALMAGASGMSWRDFLIAAGSGNLAIALVWSLAGALGRQADSLQWVLIGSLAVPVAITWLLLGRTLQTPSSEL